MKALLVFGPPIAWIIAWLMCGFSPTEIETSEKAPAIWRRDLVPFSLVCSENGRFNYVTEGGYVFPLYDFATLEEAVARRDEMKAMAERDKREAHVWTEEELKQQAAVQNAQWNYCQTGNAK